MTALWTDHAAAQATHGTLEGRSGWQAQGLSIDSRTVAPGDLFLALSGPQHDGHRFVGQALAAGAAAAIVHHLPSDLPETAPLLIVPDTEQALTDLALAARARVSAQIVAVTGSVGKTGTKEMLQTALSAIGPTHATVGNLNNHWGAPLSLARMPDHSRFGVFELGMNHAGEIAPLSQLVRPHVAIITAVEAVHLAHFSSTHEIAAAKAEIFSGVTPGGIAILPRDNPHFEELRDFAKAAGVEKIRTFGNHIDSHARLLHCGVDATGTTVFALLGDREISFRIGIVGRQWAQNSLAVLLALEALSVDLTTTTAALASMSAPKGRGARSLLPWGNGPLLMIDESYNASPVSMQAAIAALGAAHPGNGGRRIAVLGDMLELGESAPDLHRELEASLQHWAVDQLFAAGPLMANLFEAVPAAMRGGYAADVDRLIPELLAAVKANDVVMIKGSAGSRMSRVVTALQSAATATSAACEPR